MAEENFPGLMIFIDFQKAFDTIEWCYLQRCLESFNFGPEFIRWVMTFYNNIQSCMINNGITSDYFTLERGVRQGDPLSPYLFVIAVETLAIAVRQNTAINIVYVIESAAYGVLFTSCLCQKPERARYERVRAFDTNNE